MSVLVNMATFLELCTDTLDVHLGVTILASLLPYFSVIHRLILT